MSNVKYLYVRNSYKKRDITIVSDLFDSDGKVFIRCGWAFRCNHDKFIKREGRKLAFDRMINSDENFSAVIEVDRNDIKFYNIASLILSEISSKNSTPRKYVDDINDDLLYFTKCSLDGKPTWDSILKNSVKFYD